MGQTPREHRQRAAAAEFAGHHRRCACRRRGAAAREPTKAPRSATARRPRLDRVEGARARTASPVRDRARTSPPTCSGTCAATRSSPVRRPLSYGCRSSCGAIAPPSATEQVAAVAIAGLWLLHGYRQTANERASDAEAAVASLLARQRRAVAQLHAMPPSAGPSARPSRSLTASCARVRRCNRAPGACARHHDAGRGALLAGDFAAAANLARAMRWPMASGSSQRHPTTPPPRAPLALAARHLGHALQRQGAPGRGARNLQRAVDLRTAAPTSRRRPTRWWPPSRVSR